MKKITLILSTILACALSAQAKLNVVATLPDFGSLAREIGGDKINLVVLAKATEDPHFVDARPSFVVSLRNADVLIDGGAELELGWLPKQLLNTSRNHFPPSMRRMRVFTRQITKSSRPPSTRSCRNGARQCCR